MSVSTPQDPEPWVELEQNEYSRVWDRIYSDFRFRPSMNADRWPGFSEPDGSITWSVASLFAEERVDAGVEAIGEALRQGLDKVRGDDEYVLALDWQHRSYRFRPQVAPAPVDLESWLVPPLPDGDYYLFLATDFRFGWLTHPWEQTICCFGDLLSEMRSVLDGLGLGVVRGVRDPGSP